MQREHGSGGQHAQGAIGEVRQVRASYLQDWLADEGAPYVWRLDRALAGSGALGDIGAHAIDLSQFITGHALGYEHGFSHQVKDLVDAIVGERQAAPDFASGLQVQRVLAAIEASAVAGSAWTRV